MSFRDRFFEETRQRVGPVPSPGGGRSSTDAPVTASSATSTGRGSFTFDDLSGAISRTADGIAGRDSGSPLGGAIDRLGRRIVGEYDKGLLRRVSMLGVDPRSSEGQQILDLLLMEVPINSPEVKSLVDEYQSKLIGPQSRKSQAPGVVQGPFANQYGYQAGDEFRELDNLSTEYLARIQDRMAALGMLDGFVLGRKDQNTVKAFSELLWMSNAEGTSWIVQLSDLEKQKELMGEDWAWGDGSGGRDRAPFVAPTYLAPDYATLAQTVKGQLRSELGRDPDESEIALLTAELSGWDREAFDNEVAAARAEYDAAEEGRDVPGVAQAIDPLARFKESFESKFAGEIQGIERTEEAAETSENVRGAVSTLSQMSGGMG